VRIDVRYVDRSLAFDLMILAKTVRAVLQGSGDVDRRSSHCRRASAASMPPKMTTTATATTVIPVPTESPTDAQKVAAHTSTARTASPPTCNGSVSNNGRARGSCALT
jgi:hypothetical protein